ncbi:DUF4215 domain-containing protein, partial [Pseudomonadota bacterium]
MSTNRQALCVKRMGLSIVIGIVLAATALPNRVYSQTLDQSADTAGVSSYAGRLKSPDAAPLAGFESTTTKPANANLNESIGTLALLEPNPLPLCYGHGGRTTFYETDWEAGDLGEWIPATHDVANLSQFSTPDWVVVTGLPDGRPGYAAFVANVTSGDCDPEIGLDNESGALNLDSPTIVIPEDTVVPRIAVNHWVATEYEFDGGNFKYSRNGGLWTLVPAAAVEISPYNGSLLPADGLPPNTNPLAGEPAFTGSDDGFSGSWGQSQINLYDFAEAGDSIRLRFDFGVDVCDGLIGWYVDEVVAYSCSEEPPPSDCGNGVLDGSEQCDDGNTYLGDGCSNYCEVEDGWTCFDPTPAGEVGDPGFEGGTPSAIWAEASTNFDSPICNRSACSIGSGSGPASGAYWAWFGGADTDEEASLSQTVTVPSTVTNLSFELEISRCDSAADYLEVIMDGSQVFFVDGSSPQCGSTGYVTRTADISAFADDGPHVLEIHAETFSNNADSTNFFVDDVSLPGTPSQCFLDADLSSLRIVKKVMNDNGGTATAADFDVSSSAGELVFDGGSGTNPTVYTAATLTPLKPGMVYALSESDVAGYSEGSWSCGANDGGGPFNAGTVTLAPGENATCEITNDDDPPNLTLIKKVTNNNGGAAEPGEWTLTAEGYDPGNPLPGTYPLSEEGPAGYTRTSLTCDNAVGEVDSVTLGVGEQVTCTFVNDDEGPGLTLLKQVIKDNGGTAVPADWMLTASGPTGFSGKGPSVSNNPGFNAGTYDLSESGPGGYSASDWTCSGGTQDDANTITLGPGEAAICTITNDDDPPSLTLLKQVIKNNGGTAL